MNVIKRLKGRICNLFVLKSIIAIGAFLIVYPLALSAKTVEMWQLDNFFSVAGGTSPDGQVTVVNIDAGDTIKWTNMGSTDHTTTNDVIVDQGIFEGDLFDSHAMGPGSSFSHTFDKEGEFPYFCEIHGREDMAGKVIVGKGGGDGDGGGKKSFTFECERDFEHGIFGIEALMLNIGEEVGCTLRLVNPVAGVKVGINNRTFLRNAVIVDALSDKTDANGEIRYNIIANNKGTNWVGWAVPDDKGEIKFNKKAYDEGKAWGAFMHVE